MSVPPGSSYLASNTYIKLKRHLLNLEAPVRVQFKGGWKAGNPLYEWYQRRSSRDISVIQLRKERNAPFFHEYVVFRLDDGRCFRVDRRQLPDETVPLDSIYQQGVEAYDTIEEVTSLEDSPYSPSDRLMEINTTPLNGVHIRIQLELVLETLWQIHSHPSTQVYTLQRYNCYFVAQTIFWCAMKSIPDSPRVESPRKLYTHRRSEIGKDQGPDWNMAYPTAAVSGHYYHPSRRHNSPDPTTAGALPRILCHLFEKIDRCDRGLETMCLSHYNSCSLCCGQRLPFPPPGMTFNASGRIRASGQPARYMNSTNALLSRFRDSLVGFWKQAFESATESRRHAIDSTKCHFELEIVSRALDEAFPPDASMRSSWSKCARGALRDFAKGLGPKIQRALECSTRGAWLTPEVSESVYSKWRMEDWAERIAAFLDSGYTYKSLESALKAEVAALCAQDLHFERTLINLPRLDTSLEIPGTELMKGLGGNARHSLVYMKENLAQLTATREDLDRYLDLLIKIHCDRVEQYKFWLKCTSPNLRVDILEARARIWGLLQLGSERGVKDIDWLYIDPAKFSLVDVGYRYRARTEPGQSAPTPSTAYKTQGRIDPYPLFI